MNINKNKKRIIFTVLLVILSALTINTIILHNRYNELKTQTLEHINSEWYQFYRMTEIISKNYINRDTTEGIKYSMYVNQICYHFHPSVKPSDLTVNIRRLLTEAYDPIFTNLSTPEETMNKDDALKLLTAMNDFLMSISEKIIKSDDIEWILKPTSTEYLELNTQVEEFTIKYMELVESYFRGIKLS